MYQKYLIYNYEATIDNKRGLPKSSITFGNLCVLCPYYKICCYNHSFLKKIWTQMKKSDCVIYVVGVSND